MHACLHAQTYARTHTQTHKHNTYIWKNERTDRQKDRHVDRHTHRSYPAFVDLLLMNIFLYAILLGQNGWATAALDNAIAIMAKTMLR